MLTFFKVSGVKTSLLVISLLMFLESFVVPNLASASPSTDKHFLRPNCVWQDEKNYVQTCKVYSRIMHRNMKVQIRAGGSKGVYFLDGARATEEISGWLKFTRIVTEFTNDKVTLIFPVGGLSSWYADWDKKSHGQPYKYKWNTFVDKELPQYLTHQFGVRDWGNSILGLSMSAAAAIRFAAQHPKRYKTVLAMSGYYQTGSLQTGIIDQVLNASNSMDMYPPFSPKWWRESPSNPANLEILRKNKVKVIVSIGDSIPYNKIFLWGSANLLSTYESYSSLSTASFAATAAAVRLPVEFQLAPGNHIWEQWTAVIRRNKKLIVAY